MRRLLLLVAVAALGYLAWPYWCAYSLARGAETGDRAALERYVDWPALRTSAKEEVGGALMAAQGALGGLGVGPSAADLGSALVGQAVDAALTPQAVSEMIARSKSGGSAGGAGRTAGPGGIIPAKFSRENVKWAFFESPTSFVVDLAPRADREEIVKLRFRLDGFVWKLSDVDLPQNFSL